MNNYTTLFKKKNDLLHTDMDQNECDIIKKYSWLKTIKTYLQTYQYPPEKSKNVLQQTMYQYIQKTGKYCVKKQFIQIQRKSYRLALQKIPQEGHDGPGLLT